MVVHFVRKRLHVGYRKSDWSNVWYEPQQKDKDQDDDGNNDDSGDDEPDITLYKLATGGKQKREPQEDEVNWHPHFDPRNCEADSRPGKRHLQKQFLWDAWHYLEARTPAKVQYLEDKLDKPNHARWQTWFKHAKIYKAGKMRRKVDRTEKKIRDARAAGMAEVEIRKEIQEESSDDSGFESDEEEQTGQRSSTPAMPPPPTPRNNKRKVTGSNVSGRKQTLKKSRPGAFETPLNRRYPTPLMSGGLGFRGSLSINGDDDDQSQYDYRPPAVLPSREINAHNLEHIPPPSGQRRRANSRESSILSLRGRSNNGHADRDEHFPTPERLVADREEQISRLHNYNGGGLTEDEAYAQAIRASEQPEDHSH